MAKTVRIGSGLGFYGDSWEPVAASVMRGDVNYIASDHLAELTLAILQKDRQRDPGLGYARDMMSMLIRLWPLMLARGVRFICNAGGLNPAGAAAALQAVFAAKGWRAKIAVVSGDDVLPQPMSTTTTSRVERRRLRGAGPRSDRAEDAGALRAVVAGRGGLLAAAQAGGH